MAPRRTLVADTPPHAFKPSSGPSVRCTTCGRGKASAVHHTEGSPQSSSPSAQTQSSPTVPPSHTNTPPNRVSTTMPRPTQSQCSKLCSVTGSGVRCPASPPCHVIVHLTSEQFTFYWHAAPHHYAYPLKWLGYYCTTCEYVHPLGSCCVQHDRNHKLFHVASVAVLWPPRAHASHYDLGSCPLAEAEASGGGVSCASPKLWGASRRVKPTLTFDAGFA